MNTAIIVAAGSGKRLDSAQPKQFLEISGKPVIIHTLERFELCSAIDQIILVISADKKDHFHEIAKGVKLEKLEKIVDGGSTRGESVMNGFAAVNASTAEIVAVHDGARPLVSSLEITRTIEKAREVGAACLVAPVTDTIKEISGDRIIGTIERANLRRALTPQAFRYDILEKALAQSHLNYSATDECYLVERLGYEIALVEGSARNMKITHKEDLFLAEAFLMRV